jgi:hypothetical protein
VSSPFQQGKAKMNRSHQVLAMAAAAGLLVGLASTARTEGPFRFYSLVPCRLLDTRLVDTPLPGYGPILVSGEERRIQVCGHCGVPVGAGAVVVNVTAVGPSNQGRVTVYPCGIPTPIVSTLNFPPGVAAVPNGAIVPLGPTCELCVMPFVVGGGHVHLVLDVTGYFR